MDNQNNQYVLCPKCHNYEYKSMPSCRRCGYVFYAPQPNYQQYIQPKYNMMKCNNCNFEYDFNLKKCPQCKKKKSQSTLSIIAQAFAAVAIFCPMWIILGFIFSLASLTLGIIDLAINDKTKRHTGAIDGICIFFIYILLIFCNFYI